MDDLLDLFRIITDSVKTPAWPTHPANRAVPLKAVRECPAEGEPPDLSRPFIYRHFPWLSAAPEDFAALLRAEKEVFGYTKSAIETEDDGAWLTLPGADVWGQFLARTLKINILDSRCGAETPQLLANWRTSWLKKPSFVGWVLTVAPKVTSFHVDPPYGGNFMVLGRGRKTWLFIPPEAFAEIEQRHGGKIVNALTLAELLQLDDGFLWGQIQIGAIGGGDLLYFPDGWAHYVRTTEDSFGYGGYFGAAAARSGWP